MFKNRSEADEEIDKILAAMITVAETDDQMENLIETCMGFDKEYIVPFLLAYITVLKETGREED